MTRLAALLLGLGMVLPAARADEIAIDGAVLSLIEHADVPAEVAGRIAEWQVREGEIVVAGQPVARIEDREVRLELRRSELEFAGARALAEDDSRIEVARKGADRQQQMLAELQVDLEVATRESENEIPIHAAEKAREVARNQHQRAVRSRETFKNSVSDAEVDGLLFAFERAMLEHEQAVFELSLRKTKLAAREAALATQRLAVDEALAGIRQAEALQSLARSQSDLKQHDVDIARAAVERRTVASPIDGVVIERSRQTGEWVEPGDKVLRVIRLNRLRAEGFLPLAHVDVALSGGAAVVEARLPDGSQVARPGRITFVSPEADPINQQVRIWVEFENAAPQLSPGMRARIRIAPAGAAPRPEPTAARAAERR
ncbi:MAG: HlyD family efflux transporter periplasmic adaptor subunit [Planctomyces sp.]|nr:HlyD family efflux transporter periplasmic adaptor subunit [Planctomyces sp.]